MNIDYLTPTNAGKARGYPFVCLCFVCVLGVYVCAARTGKLRSAVEGEERFVLVCVLGVCHSDLHLDLYRHISPADLLCVDIRSTCASNGGEIFHFHLCMFLGVYHSDLHT